MLSERTKRGIRDRKRDFLAIAAIMLFGFATAGVIFSQQRATLPSWVPILGSDRFELAADLTSAQAVTPGQGQSVNIAGIRVGDISGVELEDGRAHVTMEIDNTYAPLIHRDASFLLRPRTGLQDMTLELDPGTRAAPEVDEGFTVPESNTLPNIQPDQILASLDHDTQDYLKLLVIGGGQALDGRGRKLSAVLRRLEPFSRDIARLNGAIAKRRHNVKGAITAFRDVSSALASDDAHLTAFVRSSDASLQHFANQEQALRATFGDLPTALSSTRRALDSGGRLARTLGPASRALIPSARALGPSLRAVRPFFRDTVGPIRDQIRPFTRAVRTPLRHLRQGAPAFARTTSGLAGGLGELNKLTNAIGYNPPGAREGYAFWLAWLNHNTNSLFLFQDALGPLRRGIVLQSCQTANLAEGLAAARPYLKTLQEVTNVTKSTTICPLDP